MVNSRQERLDAVFHAISDPTRRSILRGLAGREESVGEIAKAYPISLAAVSKHLKVLDAAGLTTRLRRGNFLVVQLNAQGLRLAEEWLAYYKHFWTERLDALQSYLEGESRGGKY